MAMPQNFKKPPPKWWRKLEDGLLMIIIPSTVAVIMGWGFKNEAIVAKATLFINTGVATYDGVGGLNIPNTTLPVSYGTGSVSAGAVTINTARGKITYTSPSISAGTAIAVTFTNSGINSTSTINIGLNGNGSNLTLVNAYVKSQTSGSCTLNIQNLSLLSLFNSTFVIDFFIVN